MRAVLASLVPLTWFAGLVLLLLALSTLLLDRLDYNALMGPGLARVAEAVPHRPAEKRRGYDAQAQQAQSGMRRPAPTSTRTGRLREPPVGR